MTSRDEIVETIMRAYKAREEGNIEGLMATFHPHGVFELKGDKSMLEVAGTSEGHANVQAALSQFTEGFEFRKRDILNVIVDGDGAAVTLGLKSCLFRRTSPSRQTCWIYLDLRMERSSSS